jgi:hypothetical protein
MLGRTDFDNRAYPLFSCPAGPPGFEPGIYFVTSARGDNHDLQREGQSDEVTQINARGVATESVQIGRFADNCYYLKIGLRCAYIRESDWSKSGPGALHLATQRDGECSVGNDHWAIHKTANGQFVFQSKRSSFCLDRRSQDDGLLKGAVQQNFCNGTDYQSWMLRKLADLPAK